MLFRFHNTVNDYAMKKLLLVLFVFVSANVLGQFVSVNQPGVLPWELGSSWVGGTAPGTVDLANTVTIESYIDRTGDLGFKGADTRFTAGVGNPADPGVVTSYDVFVVRGDLNLTNGSAASYGFEVKPNGIVIVFGDLNFNKNKSSFTNNGILAVTGAINTQGSQHDYLGTGLFVMNEITPNVFPIGSLGGSTLAASLADIDTDVCNPAYLPGDPRRPVLDDLCIFLSNGGNAPLPVDLLAFKARIEDQKPVLSWTTASELNNDFFLVQRSYDGEEYRNIGKVVGSGTTGEVQEYTYTDESAMPGPIYYRLVQTDFDGTTETFGPLTVTLRSLTNGLVVYPNPVDNDLLKMQVYGLESGLEAVVQISDLSGRTVFTENIMVDRPESMNLEYELANQLPGGAYILNVIQGSSRYSQKLIKL